LDSTGFDTVRAHAIDVPVLGSYRFGAGPARVVAGGGLVVFRRVWGRRETRRIFTDGTGRVTHVVRPYEVSPDGASPVVIFGGLAFGWSGVAVRPELRYTHRADDPARRPHQFEIAVTMGVDAVRFGSRGR
jgi:hypothetical protein